MERLGLSRFVIASQDKISDGCTIKVAQHFADRLVREQCLS
jgi:hypothetical protein